MNNRAVPQETPSPVALLLESFPELRSRLEASDFGSPHFAYGLFAQDVAAMRKDDPMVERCFEFLNSLCRSAGPSIQNLVQVAVFEVFADDPGFSALAKQRLRGPALALFEDTVRLMGFPPP